MIVFPKNKSAKQKLIYEPKSADRHSLSEMSGWRRLIMLGIGILYLISFSHHLHAKSDKQILTSHEKKIKEFEQILKKHERMMKAHEHEILMGHERFISAEGILPKHPEEAIHYFKIGDFESTFRGVFRLQYNFFDDMSFFNDKIPDQYGYFKQISDLIFDLVYGREKYGHKAFELSLDLQNKTKWGVVDNYDQTAMTQISLNDISLGEHTHANSSLILWFKEAWMQFSFNFAFGLKCKNLHFLKAGWFPFSLGRGLAFGPYYSMVEEGSALYHLHPNASSPGINLNGELIKDKLFYDIYYSKFKDNSAFLANTFNTDKKNHVGRKYNPWSGVAKDDELWAARLRWNSFEHEKYGKLKMEPYFYFNEASDQKHEVKNDMKTQLGVYGLSVEYSKSNLEVSGEIAFNFGSENFRWIDRNKVVVERDPDGKLVERYSNVVTDAGGDVKVDVTDANKTAVEASTNRVNDTVITVAGADNVYNAADRFRSPYKNDLEGWMAVIDATYNIEKLNLQIAGEYAFASGGHHEEKDSKYKGFIGLHEHYEGKSVTTVMLRADEQNLIRITHLEPGKREVDDYSVESNGDFSDLHLLGFGATWTPEKFKSKKLSINPNVIFFWKDHKTYKYILNDNPDLNRVSTTEMARTFLGTELNLITMYKLFKNMTLAGALSIFVPGGFYDDIKGVPIEDDFYRNNFDAETRAGLDPRDYRIGTDNAFFATISLTYKF